ncbi:Cytochrome c oxidase subunit 4 [Puccinia graminis f. sp. tritici]|uniref:Cytochrome c oxidase subunit 4 n=1 Tax=Puccinia graminis f. sp. tritici TaxID=56615 RepID=A0A5B0QE20_PUCGR|nr:Cytochrome c oxidase subunit 4 [Puccinia graminis f. sp. tritici]
MLLPSITRQSATLANRTLGSVSLRGSPRFLSVSRIVQGDDHHGKSIVQKFTSSDGNIATNYGPTPSLLLDARTTNHARPGCENPELSQPTWSNPLGSERYEILSRMEGHDLSIARPLAVNHMGTLDNPVKVFSLVPNELLLLAVLASPSRFTRHLIHELVLHPPRTPKMFLSCGCAYVVDFQGDPHEHGNEEPKLSVLHEHPGEKPRLKWGWGDMTTHNGGNQR